MFPGDGNENHPDSPIALVAMPWQDVASPSIQIGTLHAWLENLGLACRSFSFHLEYAAWMASESELVRVLGDEVEQGRDPPDGSVLPDTPSRIRHAVRAYSTIANSQTDLAIGEWIFSAALRGSHSLRSADHDYLARLRQRGLNEASIERAIALRRTAHRFIERCAIRLLEEGPAVVGLTLTYQQTVASLALARELKLRRPQLPIAIGGASCDGPMGAALLRTYRFVDVALSGEAESVAAELFRALIDRQPVPDRPGISARDEQGDVRSAHGRATASSLKDSPIPEYSEYFARLTTNGLDVGIDPRVPFESSRGCWWGERSHCSFCGLNGGGMQYRSKPAGRVVSELRELATRHRNLSFVAVDNIMDLAFFDTLFPQLIEGGLDLELFYETKANLTRTQVALLRRAGVLSIQPGIESLATPILRRIHKGTTALQNVRLLKYCAEFGVRVVWNLIYGFPDEEESDYISMAQRIPSLIHFSPPSTGPLYVDRFSPYHADPDRYGIVLEGPLPAYAVLHPEARSDLASIAPSFAYRYRHDRSPSDYTLRVREQTAHWKAEHSKNRGALCHRNGPDYIEIRDGRTNHPTARYILDGVDAAIYRAIDDGGTVVSIHRALERLDEFSGHDRTESTIRSRLGEFVECGLAFQDEERYVSLSISATTRGREPHGISKNGRSDTSAAISPSIAS